MNSTLIHISKCLKPTQICRIIILYAKTLTPSVKTTLLHMLQCRHLIPALKMCRQPGHNTRPHARLPPSFLGMDYLTTERSFDSQATWVIDLLGLSFDMLSIGVWTTRYWQTFGRLVQEFNVCTVCEYGISVGLTIFHPVLSIIVHKCFNHRAHWRPLQELGSQSRQWGIVKYSRLYRGRNGHDYIITLKKTTSEIVKTWTLICKLRQLKRWLATHDCNI